MNTIIKNATCAPQNRFWFDDFLTREVGDLFKEKDQSSLIPSTNIWTDDSKIFLEMALPGIKKESVKIKVESNLINISSEEITQENSQERNFIRKEFGKASYSRSFKINQNLYDLNTIDASMENGILLISIAKREEVKKEFQFVPVK